MKKFRLVMSTKSTNSPKRSRKKRLVNESEITTSLMNAPISASAKIFGEE